MKELPSKCFYFKNDEGTVGFVFAELVESGAFQYGNGTTCTIDLAEHWDGGIFAAKTAIDTRYMPVTTDEGFIKFVRSWLENRYGELTEFGVTGITHW